MLTIGILVALLSAITQAIAHGALKGGRDKLVVRGIIAAVSGLLLAPATLVVPLPSGELWCWLALAGCTHAVYQLVLIRAYEAADFSVAYPLARGVVPIVTAAAGVVLLGDRLSVVSTTGIIVVATGILFVARAKRVSSSARTWAMISGSLTAIYTVIDGHAMRLAPNPSTFIVWFFVVDAFLMMPLTALTRRSTLWAGLRREGLRGVFAGLTSVITYGSALVALRLLPIGVASSLRETSLVFGMLIARFWLREPADSRRYWGAALVLLGGGVIVVGST